MFPEGLWGGGGLSGHTAAEDDLLIGNLLLGLQAGVAPVLGPELMPAFMDRDLDALDGRGSHSGVVHTQLQLPAHMTTQI